jgi:hypothetical protein
MPNRWSVIASKKNLAALLVFLIPILSCSSITDIISPATPTPTPTATPTRTPTATPTATATITPTPVPLAERDLKEIALQASDLPGSFIEIDIPNVESLVEQMSDDSSSEALENLEEGFAALFTSSDDEMYINAIFVFRDAEYAKTSYDLMIENSDGDEMDVPAIGEECIGYDSSSGSTAGYTLMWRYREAVVLLAYSGKDAEAEEIIGLAETIQGRLEAV